MAHDLHQPGGVTDICIGMDYDFLQLKHLDQEMSKSPRHLGTSVFEGGQGVGPSKVEEP
jgi:hypothetical protein